MEMAMLLRNVAITKPGYTLETVWKKSGTNYAVGFTLSAES